MTAPILYCGDTSLEGAASYLAGLMTHFGWSFEYVPSDQDMTREIIERPRSLLILSDYPAARFGDVLQHIAVDKVRQGMGLLMIGGWESFHGLGGDWDQTRLGQILPVTMSDTDDRVNFDQPTLLQLVDSKTSLWDLPWLERPPAIGGINRFQAKPDASVLLRALPYSPRWNPQTEQHDWLQARESMPALVRGSYGAGQTAAFATDVAPHWVGGFVDWGPSRVMAQAPGAPGIEVGSDYARFWKGLLAELAKETGR